MTKLDFLKSIGSFLLIPFCSRKTNGMSELQIMEEEYYKVSNRLRDFQIRSGFKPGVRVRCVFRMTVTYGTIPEYGKDWEGNQPYTIPVILDNGRKQPWTTSHLTILSS